MVHSRGCDAGSDWPRAQEEGATKLVVVEVVMDVVAGDGMQGELGAEPKLTHCL